MPPLAQPHPAAVETAERLLCSDFTYVGETHRLPDPIDWRVNPSPDREWLIAHHKLYCLVDLMQAFRLTGRVAFVDCWVRLAQAWLEQMGSGFIKASDAQVEAKRVESLVTALHIARESGAALPGRLLRDIVGRLGDECDFIARNLRPSRNHRTFQLAALATVGILFGAELTQSDDFASVGLRGLEANLVADISPAGVHVERSTHYHNLAVETGLAVLELAELNGHSTAPELRARLRKALDFSAAFQFPDGEIPLINDADTLDHAAMFHAGHRLFDDPVLLWAATRGAEGTPPQETAGAFDGYVILTNSHGLDAASFRDRTHVFADLAPLGEGSHSHYDLFSFTWFTQGEQIVVDPGRYTYDAEPRDGIDWRREFKSTRAHNTVVVDGLDQTRYLSKSAAPPPGVERYDRSIHPAKHGPDVEILWTAEDLSGSSPWIMGAGRSHEYEPIHHRAFVFLERHSLIVVDLLASTDGQHHTFTHNLQLSPRWLDRLTLSQTDGGCELRGGAWSIAFASRHPARRRLATGHYARSYGTRVPAPRLENAVDCAGNSCFVCALSPDRALRLGAVHMKGSSIVSVELPGTGALDVDFTARRVTRVSADLAP
jgi:hypothetical protein